ncbi:hypothetical protein FACS1894122_02900 [Alphaproteobacteria bacterium]|nr:hypothetical protein FACS1894122_02900 [Alphaproteobacteria bacterium]
MKNKASCIAAGFVLALSAVSTTYSANAEQQIARRPTMVRSSAKLQEKLNIIKACFGLEKKSTEKVCRISGEKLADYLGKNARLFFKSENEYGRFSELKNLMYKAHSLEVQNGNSNNLANEIMKFYEKKSKPLFDCRKLAGVDKKLFDDALREMVENPYGAKRLLSLMMLRMVGENKKNNPFAYGFERPIQIKTTAFEESSDVFNTGGFINLSLSKKSMKGNKLKKHELISSTLMHELTHFYHHLLFGMMSTSEARESMVRMASDGASRLTKILFPTQDLDKGHTFGKFSDAIFKAIGNKKNDKRSLSELLNDLRTPPARKKEKDSAELLPITKEKYDDYCHKLKTARTKDSLKKISANLIAEYAFSPNYWTDQEEMLTIFGLVPTIANNERVIIIDRDNQSAFEGSPKLKGKLKHFTHKRKYFAESASKKLGNVLKNLRIASVYKETVNDYQEVTREKVSAMFRKGYTCGNILYPEHA